MVSSTHLALFVVNHDIVRLDVPVHDALGMAKVERFEQLKDIVSDVVVGEFGVERFEFGILLVSVGFPAAVLYTP